MPMISSVIIKSQELVGCHGNESFRAYPAGQITRLLVLKRWIMHISLLAWCSLQVFCCFITDSIRWDKDENIFSNWHLQNQVKPLRLKRW